MGAGINYMSGSLATHVLRKPNKAARNQATYLANHARPDTHRRAEDRDETSEASVVRRIKQSRKEGEKRERKRGRPEFDFEFARRDGGMNAKENDAREVAKKRRADDMVDEYGEEEEEGETRVHNIAVHEVTSASSLRQNLLSMPDWAGLTPSTSTPHQSGPRPSKSSLKLPAFDATNREGDKTRAPDMRQVSTSPVQQHRSWKYKGIASLSTTYAPAPPHVPRKTSIDDSGYDSSIEPIRLAENDIEDSDEILEFPSFSFPLPSPSPSPILLSPSFSPSIESSHPIPPTAALKYYTSLCRSLSLPLPPSLLAPIPVDWTGPCSSTRHQRAMVDGMWVFSRWEAEDEACGTGGAREEAWVHERLGLGYLGPKKVEDRTSESSGRTVAPISVIPPPKAASVSRESQANRISSSSIEPPPPHPRQLNSYSAPASAPIPASIVTSARLTAPSYNPLSASPFSLTKPTLPRPTPRQVPSVTKPVSVSESDSEEAKGGIVAGPVLFDDKEWDF